MILRSRFLDARYCICYLTCLRSQCVARVVTVFLLCFVMKFYHSVLGHCWFGDMQNARPVIKTCFSYLLRVLLGDPAQSLKSQAG